MMNIYLKLGGVTIRIDADRPLTIDDRLQNFVTAPEVCPDAVLSISWANDLQAPNDSLCVGEDLLRKHYRDGNRFYCVAKSGVKGISAATEYAPDFSYLHCTINNSVYLEPLVNLASILRFCPMMALFQYFDALFFHASQIEYCGKGILFTAPSGTGKSTQARLWELNRNARILCNDRTIIRRGEHGWLTYGYPIDGSSPISSAERSHLGAIVLLSQAPTNVISKMSLLKTAAHLMPQVVFDTWNPEARVKAMNGLLELLSEIPIYHFGCTPDLAAVECLEKQLMTDGVFENG